ncbi:sensor histidine kinase [Henriciella mobilis]|uniref:Sensor protein FixL n=1 Tax=Henriciella mobilis TaxID=2305467 RepID=A0A399R523_9PROT|nr:PAS domain-containing sensor histidine kinase [Henriciella mobilis]RIJ14623.1 PAS domain S-box protein [Henriciella mobilis]RIJ21982.1 PAS domain S-box protein [Henriciella mobilis]RIJ26398.1 PAS domain S-box protein [Henriciella mobilis]
MAEMDVDALHQHFRSILQSVPDAMVVINDAGIITAFSKAAETLFGYDANDLLGRNVSVLMAPSDKAQHDGHISRYLRTGERRIIGIGRTVTARRADGSLFPIDLKIGEAKIGDHFLFTAFMRDLTEQRRNESRMKALQAELVHFSRLSSVGTMASALAHELNQPLTVVTNYLEAARDLLESPDPETMDMVQEALNEAAKQSVRAGQIVRKLRDYVSRGEIEKRPTQLVPLIGDAVALIQAEMSSTNGEIAVSVEEGISDIMADPIQIQQVIINLVRNALEAMEGQDDPKVEIRAASVSGGLAMVTIEDNGPGIDREVADQLFKPLASSKSTGMGLGLSICKTIVEAHGGTIEAMPMETAGTRFVFTVELADRTDE